MDWQSICAKLLSDSRMSYFADIFRADSRLVPSQWETSLRSNAVSHWLGANPVYVCVTGPQWIGFWRELWGNVILPQRYVISVFGVLSLIGWGEIIFWSLHLSALVCNNCDKDVVNWRRSNHTWEHSVQLQCLYYVWLQYCESFGGIVRYITVPHLATVVCNRCDWDTVSDWLGWYLTWKTLQLNKITSMYNC